MSSQGDKKTELKKKTPYPPYNQPPQIAYGWFCPHPPPYGPYFWPCLPPGYALVPINKAQSATAPSNSLPTSSQPKDVPRPKTTHPHAVPQSISAVGPPTSAHPLPIQEIPQVNAQVLWSSQYLSQATAAMKRQHPPMTEDMRRNVKRKLGDPSRAIGVVPVASSVGPNPTSLPSPSGAPGPTVGMQ
ncbi:hypothetical protein AAMO2058_000569900 [Amorphochlora amoebiformis]|uniref:Uncharacterized protein n=1 Tax=Amorphochlora amoebiformis TaxID=1561963 RepID=A0A7S0H960_9EUKA|mmetsp:Transcript_7475/g.11562  ORF Transcript_7475/g.11562 Transcript_7475/m.11562 type:complete len:187 (+) Transcript_7475:195-755(+)